MSDNTITREDGFGAAVEFYQRMADDLRLRLAERDACIAAAEDMATQAVQAAVTARAQVVERDAKIAELEAKQWDVIAQKFIDLDEHIMATAASVGCDSVASMAREIVKDRARIAELEAAQAWVSVDERLPEPGDIVLAYLPDYEELVIVNKWPKRQATSRVGSSWHESSRVTHWMPLPPSPVTP